MKVNKKRLLVTLLLAAIVACAMAVSAFATDGAEHVSNMAGTFWSLVPPIVAIVLALITKEVYSSLFIGILVGALFYANFNFEITMTHLFVDGYVAVLSDSWNVGILLFLVVLGAMVALMNKAGGSAAFGRWATTHIKTKVGAQLATIVLGCLIFIDDYFNCLTVGSVMRPVTDKFNISRAKLAYLIDATAAPVCIIAPISSWAAAVTGFVEGANGLSLFISAIPYNFYALLTIVMMVCIVVMKFDFGPMKKHEAAAQTGDLWSCSDADMYKSAEEAGDGGRGRVIDLVLPVVILIIACVIGMIYTGGFFSGTSFVDAFAGSDASVGLVLGSFAALIISIIYFLIRRVLNFKECMECIPEGFKAMVPAIMILACAWALKAMTDSLGAAEYVAGLVEASAGSFMSFLPAIIFLVAVGLAFATGTSWGTFGILIPIVVAVFEADMSPIMIISISACMAGAVCGDHCSPISDTTIMASAGALSNHINHVSTQLPYAILTAVISCIFYIVAGFVRSVVVLPIAIVCTVLIMFAIRALTKGKAKAE